MNREILLATKAAELTESLQQWAKDNLAAGEQLLVSLRVQTVTAALIDPEDSTAIMQNLLKTKVVDYFALRRLRNFPAGVGIPVRTYNCLVNDGYHAMSLREFVETVSEAELLRIPNFGRMCLVLVRSVLSEDGLKLKGS